VVRIGDTVRRPWRESTVTVHAYLNHLADEGVSFVPRVLGRDDQGREMLSFVPGEVPVAPLPPWATTDETLADLGALIRRLHDAAQTWHPPGSASWGHLPGSVNVAAGQTEPTELVAHGDYCPGNVVFREQRPAAFIDFDLIKPTTRVIDCVNALHWWVPLTAPQDRPEQLSTASVATIGDRVMRFADAYSLDRVQRAQLVPQARRRAKDALAWAQRAAPLDPVISRWWREGWQHSMPRTIEWLRVSADELSGALAREG
jgi:Ser/Thr protein kinase RdoA (MazF antagonist)